VGLGQDSRGLAAASEAARPVMRRVAGVPVAVGWILAAALPLVGLISLLLRSKLDPNWTNRRVDFVLFLAVGGAAFILAYAAGESAERRGDARVLLLSLAFLATGGFLGLHAIGTPGILVTDDLSGFKVAIPAGLLVAALFGGASAFVDARPVFAPVIRRRRLLRRSVLVVMAVWVAWTVAQLPPLSRPSSEGATGSLLGAMAVLGTIIYGSLRPAT
jgi:adenylate cyclase